MSNWEKVRQGACIAVFWPKLGHYYACKVLKKDGRRCLCRYEDDSESWHNLASTKFRWNDRYEDTDDEEEREENPNQGDSDDEKSENSEDIKERSCEDLDDASEENSGVQNEIILPGKNQDKQSDGDERPEEDDYSEFSSLLEEEESVESQESTTKPKKGKAGTSEAKAPKNTKPTKSNSTEVVKQKKGTKRKAPSPKKGAKKAASRGNGQKKVSSVTSQTQSSSLKSYLTLKDIKAALTKQEISKEDALMSAMIVYHMMGSENVPFEKLVLDLGYKSKIKDLEPPWKNLLALNMVEEGIAGKQKKKVFKLTKIGIDKVAPQDYKDELANPPKMTEELHERIKANVINAYGIKIFDILLAAMNKGEAVSPDKLASECGCKRGAHNFFYAMKQLKNMGYVVPDPDEKKKLILSNKCFLD